MGKHFLWDPVEDNIVKEIDDSGTTIAAHTTEPHLYGDLISQHRDGQSSFYQYDGQGSTTSLTDSAANVTDTYAYSSFGPITARTGITKNSRQYIGQKGYLRESGTETYRARRRPYHDTSARWMTFDPRRRSFTTNKYNYAGNSPVHYVDPSGMLHISIVKNSVKLFPCGGSQVTYKVSPSQLEFPLTDDDIVIIQYTCSYIGRYRLCEYRGPRAKVDQTTRCGCHLTKEINPRKCCFYESLDGGGEDIHLTPPITKPFCTSAGSLTSITNLRVYFRTAEIDAEIAKKFKERVFTCNDGLNDHVVAAGAVSFEAPDFWKKAELIMESGSSIATMDWDCCEGGGYHRLEFEMSVSSGKPGKPIEIEFPDLPNPR